MLTTIQHVESLPIYESNTNELSETWNEMQINAHAIALEDVHQLMARARQRCSLPLLGDTQFDHVLWAKSSQNLGQIRIIPCDNYLTKTKRATVAERNQYCSGGTPLFGMEIRCELFRRFRVTHLPPPYDVISYGVQTVFEINDAPEFDAFKEIYRDWRGLFKKLFDPTPIAFNKNDVIPEIDRVRSKRPIPKLDVALAVLPPGDEQNFELEFSWNGVDWEGGLNSFLVMAVIFSCVQKAVVAPRSHREHLLNYWMALQRETLKG